MELHAGFLRTPDKHTVALGDRRAARERIELVQQALDEYLMGKAGLSDYLILGKARSAPGGELLTFDRKLAREDGVTLL